MFILYLILQLDNLLATLGVLIVLAVIMVILGAVMYCCNLELSIPNDNEKQNGLAVATVVADKWVCIGRKLFRTGLAVLLLTVPLSVVVPTTRSGLILLGLAKVRQFGEAVNSQTGVYGKALKLLEQKLDEALDGKDGEKEAAK